MGRIFLIIGGIIGGLILAAGVLVVISANVQPDSNQSDEIFGAIVFIVVGLVIAVPCVFFAYRMTQPTARQILLIIGGIIGGLIFVLGVLELIVSATEPGPDQGIGYVLFGVVTFVGLAIAAPCFFFAYRMTPTVAFGMQSTSAGVPPAGANAEQRYLQWFTWCQQAIGGDAITLHAATMAALKAPDDPTGAAQSEASRQASRAGSAGAMPPPVKQAKVKTLARIAASTLGVLEPSERVLVSFSSTNRSPGAVAVGALFGVIGTAIAASSSGLVFVTVTDRRVIALIAGAYGGLANKVALADSRATVTAKFPKGLFGGRRPFSIKGMSGGSISAAVPRPWMPEALMAFELIQPSSMSQIGMIR